MRHTLAPSFTTVRGVIASLALSTAVTGYIHAADYVLIFAGQSNMAGVGTFNQPPPTDTFGGKFKGFWTNSMSGSTGPLKETSGFTYSSADWATKNNTIDGRTFKIGGTWQDYTAWKSTWTGIDPFAGAPYTYVKTQITGSPSRNASGDFGYIGLNPGDPYSCTWDGPNTPQLTLRGYGPEYGVAKALSAARNDTFYIIKFAYSGSAIATWKPGSGANYLAMKDWVSLGLSAAPRSAKIAGFFWMQGETDALAKGSAQAYDRNLKDLFDGVRRDFASSAVPGGIPIVLGVVTSGLPAQRGPVYNETLGSDTTQELNYVLNFGANTPPGPNDGSAETLALVQNAQRAIATNPSYPKVAFVDTPLSEFTLVRRESSALPRRGTFIVQRNVAPVHFDQASIHLLGRRMGEAWLRLMPADVQPPTIAQPATGPGTNVLGTTASLSVLGTAPGGAAETTLTYDWSCSDPSVSFSPDNSNAAKNTTATFTKAGTFTCVVQITSVSGGSVSSQVQVIVAQTLTSIAVSPATTSVEVGQSTTFTARGNDQFGNQMATQPVVTWAITSNTASGSTVNPSTGAFTAGASAGTAIVQASASSKSGTATVTVMAVNASPTITAVASAAPATVSETSTVVSVRASDDAGEPALSYTWTPVGSIPAAVTLGAGNGTNAGKDLSITFSKAGTYNLQVTVTDAGGKSATSQVQVQVQQTAQTVSVSPSTASILIGQSQTFTFGVRDQFGSPIASPQPATWSFVSSTANGSTIDASSGLFLAGASAGSATVQASVGGKSSTASITVTPGSSGTGVTPTPVDDSSSSGGCGTGVMLGLMLTSLTLLGLRRRNV